MWIRSLHVFAVLGCLLMATALQAQVVEEESTEVLKPIEKTYQPRKRPDLAEAATRIIDLTNKFRKDEELEKVAVNPELTAAAQYFANYMARTSRYGHKADGNAPADRARKFEYDHCIVAENIAYEFNSAGFSTAELASGFVEGWKHSPGHRRNMLDSDVIETGVAVSQGTDSGYFFAVQMFGRPRSMTVEFKITNESETQAEYKMGDRAFVLPPRHMRTHQVCRPRDLMFRWSDNAGHEETVQPGNGDQFVIWQEGARLRIRREQHEGK